MRQRGFLVLLLVAALAAAATAHALTRTLPQGVASSLLGARMIRAEVALKTADGVLHDFRLDRGRLVRRYSKGTLQLLERDGTRASLKVAPTARVLLNGRPSTLRALRAGMQVAVSRDHDAPADAVYASGAKKAPKLPAATVSFLMGPRMYRGEVALLAADGATHDIRLDHGRIRQLTPTAIILREADNSLATVPFSALARVKLNGRTATAVELKRGMIATTMRDGDKPADQIWATGR